MVAEKYKIQEINRTEIKNAEYNPRVMPAENMHKLKEGLKSHGMVMPIVVNKTTMNIVNGHQRVRAMDSVNKTSNYKMTVAMIEVDEQKEKEINIALNNTNLMGDFDMEKLQSLFDEGTNFVNAGFDPAEIREYFKTEEDLSYEEMEQMANSLRDIKEMEKKVFSGKDVDFWKDNEFYTVLVFRNKEERDNFNKIIGVELEKVMISGDYLKSYVEDRVAPVEETKPAPSKKRAKKQG